MERFFLGGNTAKGFYSLYEKTLDKLDRVIMLKGGAGTGKSTLMKKVAREASRRGLDYEEWYCSGDPTSLDGVYIPALSSAVVDATPPHSMDPKFPMIKERIVNLADGLNEDALIPSLSQIEKLVDNKKRCFSCAYEHLNIALGYKQIIDRLNGDSLDEYALRSFAVRFAESLNARSLNCGGVGGDCRRVFCRAITPDGDVCFYDGLRDKEIIWVRGGAVSRKLFFDEVLSLTENKLSFANPLCPNETDGIIVGSFALVSDVGHLLNDVSEVVDLAVFEGGGDKYAIDIADVEKNKRIAAAEDCLAQARSFHFEIEKFYVAAMDFTWLTKIQSRVLTDIFKE